MGTHSLLKAWLGHVVVHMELLFSFSPEIPYQDQAVSSSGAVENTDIVPSTGEPGKDWVGGGFTTLNLSRNTTVGIFPQLFP